MIENILLSLAEPVKFLLWLKIIGIIIGFIIMIVGIIYVIVVERSHNRVQIYYGESLFDRMKNAIKKFFKKIIKK